MSDRDQKRAAMLEKLYASWDVDDILRNVGIGAEELADRLLDMEARFVERTGGPPHFTGNNRVFANGAVAYQVECRKCKQCFWVTTLARALCPDCDRTGLFV